MARKSQWDKANSERIWNAGAYLRLSRQDGDNTESDSIGNQKLLMRHFLDEEVSGIVLYQEYVDDGFSGMNFERPAFQEMLEDMRDGYIDCVIVKDLSRFGRERLELGRYLEREFPMRDIRFISILDHLDSYLRPEEMENALVPMKAVMNEEYCRDISRKIRSSLNAKRRNGEFIGNYAPYGYLKDPRDKHRLVVDEKTAWVVERIFCLFVEGTPQARIAKIFNAEGIKTPSQYKVEQGIKSFAYHNGNAAGKAWSITTIRRILTDEVYIGNLVQGQYKNKSYKIQKLTPVDKSKWITVHNTHEAIIDPYTFNLAQDILSRNARKAPKNKEPYPLSGYIKCGDCKMGMIRHGSGQYIYYTCSTSRKLPGECSSHSIREDVLFPAIVATLRTQIQLFLDKERILNDLENNSNAGLLQHIKAAKRKKQSEYQELSEVKMDLYSDLKKGLITEAEYLELKKGYAAQLELLEDDIEEINKQLAGMESRKHKDNSVAEKLRQYENMRKLTRKVVVELIDEVYVYEDKTIEVIMKFQDEFLRHDEMVQAANR